ncbi:MAG: hypothetical protein ABI451_07370 [Dokdonella sp.]
MTQRVCYASLAIYSKSNVLEEISGALQKQPVLTGDRAGKISWIYSTRDELRDGSIEDHLKSLKLQFNGVTQELTRFSKKGLDIRVWIYFGAKDVNQSFLLSEDFLTWISMFGADICVDVWN